MILCQQYSYSDNHVPINFSHFFSANHHQIQTLPSSGTPLQHLKLSSLSPHIIINLSCLLLNQLLFHHLRQTHTKSTLLIHVPTTTSSINTSQPYHYPDPNMHTYLTLIVGVVTAC